jgi:hypothetical protein
VPWPHDAPDWLVREVGEDYIAWEFQEQRFAPYILEPIADPEDTNIVAGVMALSKKGRGVGKRPAPHGADDRVASNAVREIGVTQAFEASAGRRRGLKREEPNRQEPVKNQLLLFAGSMAYSNGAGRDPGILKRWYVPPGLRAGGLVAVPGGLWRRKEGHCAHPSPGVRSLAHE